MLLNLFDNKIINLIKIRIHNIKIKYIIFNQFIELKLIIFNVIKIYDWIKIIIGVVEGQLAAGNQYMLFHLFQYPLFKFSRQTILFPLYSIVKVMEG